MKTYDYRSDGEMGQVEATSLHAALDEAKHEAGITKATLDDGAWLWVEDPDTGARLEVGIVP